MRARSPSLAALIAVLLAGLVVVPALASADPVHDRPAERIYGGVEADADDVPSMAMVLLLAGPGVWEGLCGGTLVSSTQVLTAAHCVVGGGGVRPASEVIVALETLDLAAATEDHLHSVVDIEVHPGYDPDGTGRDDLAVLSLTSPVETPVTRVADPSESELWSSGTMATIAGWGLVSQWEAPSKLQAAEVPVENCFPGFLCAGTETGAGACSGDSGGPMLVDDAGGQPVLVGAAALGEAVCGAGASPTLYTDLTAPGVHSWLVGQLPPPSDTRAPRVSEAAPTGRKVARGSAVTVGFSEAVDRTTVTARSFRLLRVTKQGTRKVRGNVVSVAADGLSARLDPLGPGARLARGTRYRAVVTTGVRDAAGNVLDQAEEIDGQQPKSWTFRTRG